LEALNRARSGWEIIRETLKRPCQDRANHIHSVWRDLRRDFAGDLLAQHYAGVRH
jgi:hypothetical protein